MPLFISDNSSEQGRKFEERINENWAELLVPLPLRRCIQKNSSAQLTADNQSG
jgi:hypothetical protein